MFVCVSVCLFCVQYTLVYSILLINVHPEKLYFFPRIIFKLTIGSDAVNSKKMKIIELKINVGK